MGNILFNRLLLQTITKTWIVADINSNCKLLHVSQRFKDKLGLTSSCCILANSCCGY